MADISIKIPNEFVSMTARKDDSSRIKSIFCHKRSYETIKRPITTIKGHTRLVARGHAGPQKATYGPLISSFRNDDFLFNFEQFSLQIFIVPFVKFLVREYFLFPLEQFLFVLKQFFGREHFLFHLEILLNLIQRQQEEQQ